MKWPRFIAASLTGLTYLGLIAPGVVCMPGAAAASPCVLKPLMPHLVAFAHSVERREISLRITCLLEGPVSLGVFRGGTRLGSIVRPGNRAGVVGDGALGTMTLHQDRTPPGHYTVPPQLVGPAGVRSAPGGFTAKDATRATLVIGRVGDHLVAYGETELFDHGWNKQEFTARLEVRRHGTWVLYRRFDSDAKASEGFYGDYRVRLPAAAQLYRVDIRATTTRAKYVSRPRAS